MAFTPIEDFTFSRIEKQENNYRWNFLPISLSQAPVKPVWKGFGTRSNL